MLFLVIIVFVNYGSSEVLRTITESFEYIMDRILYVYENNKASSISLFILVYVISTSISLPIASVLTLFAGSIFGLWIGLVVVSVSSVLGATISMLVSRFLISDFIEKKFGERIKTIHKNIEEFGIQYLLILRISPIFPFFLVNIAMGLTKMKVIPYMITSAIGMLPGTLLYVYAGDVGAEVLSLSDGFYKIVVILIVIVLFSIMTKIIYKKYFCANGRT